VGQERVNQSWDAAVFDRLYAASDDPWDFQGSVYEREKYARTIEALGDARFGRALEVGCSIGVLTRLLAERCGQMLALDGAARAVGLARARCADLAHIAFAQASVPRDWPEGSFDLLVFSEILYFLTEADIGAVAWLARQSVTQGGTILLVNWTGATDTPCTGEAAAEFFIAAAGLPSHLAHRADTYRVDILQAR
jgi:SAM-dependent methyltransferase